MPEYYAVVKFEADEPQDHQAMSEGVFVALQDLEEDHIRVTEVAIMPQELSEQCNKLIESIFPGEVIFREA